jgi:hypothetical protein
MNTYIELETVVQSRIASKKGVIWASLLISLTLLTFFSGGCKDSPALTPDELGEVLDESPVIPGADRIYEFPAVEDLWALDSVENIGSEEDPVEPVSGDEDDEGIEETGADPEPVEEPIPDSDEAPIFQLIAPDDSNMPEEHEDPEYEQSEDQEMSELE